jgi:drug/metabolite transporter (DMT)-like permease
VFYFALIGSVITFIPMIRVWVNPDPVQWVMLISIGLLATIGQWLLTRGYASAPVGQLAVFHYSAVVFAGLVDWIVWSEKPGLVSMTGVGLICIAGVLASKIRA